LKSDIGVSSLLPHGRQRAPRAKIRADGWLDSSATIQPP
jgi:hypothetical protein